jgi:hypothetical protein
MTEEEIVIATAKHKSRSKAFMDAGLARESASDLADKLFERDLDSQDDRRLCFECRIFDTKSGTCPKIVDKKGKPQPALKFVLQRCDWIQLKGKK